LLNKFSFEAEKLNSHKRATRYPFKCCARLRGFASGNITTPIGASFPVSVLRKKFATTGLEKSNLAIFLKLLKVKKSYLKNSIKKIDSQLKIFIKIEAKSL